jgi:hypothetical protein
MKISLVKTNNASLTLNTHEYSILEKTTITAENATPPTPRPAYSQTAGHTHTHRFV